MFRYLRINDPYRLITIFFILILLQLVYLLGNSTVTVLDWYNMLLGEKLSHELTLYKDIYTNSAPLSAGIYSIIDSIFGKSELVYRMLGVLLIWFQASIFNFILNSVKANKESNFVPAFVYGILNFMFFDIASLTPMQMSMPFILISIYFALSYNIVNRRTDNMLIMNGFSIGMAALFYWPSLIYLLGVELCLVFFTNTVFRRYLLLLICSLIPIGLCFSYYYWLDSLNYLIYEGIIKSISLSVNWASLKHFIFILFLPSLMASLGLLKLSNAKGFTFNQVGFRFIMLMMLVIGFVILVFSKQKSTGALVYLIPPMAYFISNFFLLIKKKFLAEVLFFAFTVVVLFINFGSFFKVEKISKYVSTESLSLAKNPYEKLVKGKSVLVLGDKIEYYQGAIMKGPYLDWAIAEKQIANLDYYDNIMSIYNVFEKEKPEFILDQENLFEKFSEKMPYLKNHYDLESNGVYKRKN